jgi:hypothetical protein
MRVRPILPLAVLAFGLLAPALTPRTARAQNRDPGVGSSASPTGGLYYALVIGNDDYDSLPKLGSAARDARAVEQTLRETYGFQTTLLVNATRSVIVAALSSYAGRLSADASLLIYYAGRGYRDAKAGKAYWLPVDATREDASKWVSADDITNRVRAVRARHVLVVSDSCYSGALPGGLAAPPSRPEERERFLQKTAAGRSRTLMASGGDEPEAGNFSALGRSVFAAALLSGLSRMEWPRFTASELFLNHVLNSVARRTGQTPVYNPLRNSGHESGDFVFTRVKPAAPAAVSSSCADEATKLTIWKTFLKNFKGDSEQQEVAYDVGMAYVSRYHSCPEEDDKKIISYIQRWLERYEEYVRGERQRWQSRRP